MFHNSAVFILYCRNNIVKCNLFSSWVLVKISFWKSRLYLVPFEDRWTPGDFRPQHKVSAWVSANHTVYLTFFACTGYSAEEALDKNHSLCPNLPVTTGPLASTRCNNSESEKISVTRLMQNVEFEPVHCLVPSKSPYFSVAFVFTMSAEAKCLYPWIGGDITHSGLGLSYRIARLHGLSGRYGNPVPESAIYPPVRD